MVEQLVAWVKEAPDKTAYRRRFLDGAGWHKDHELYRPI
jgi:hypothetical protein